MIYNFANERKLIPKYDDGDIGEFLRFSQNWAMFTVPPKASRHDIFVGTIGITKDIIRTGNNEKTSTVMNVTQEVDVWEWMKNGEFVPIDLNIRKKQIWNNMTHIYPSPRLERMFSEWSSHTNTKALTYFLKKLCIVGPFLDLTFIWQHLHITSPTVEGPRFSKSRNDKVFHMNCNKSVKVAFICKYSNVLLFKPIETLNAKILDWPIHQIQPPSLLKKPFTGVPYRPQ